MSGHDVQATDLVRPCDSWCDPQTGQHAPWCTPGKATVAGGPQASSGAACEDYYCCNPFHEHDTYGWPACWNDEQQNYPPTTPGGAK